MAASIRICNKLPLKKIRKCIKRRSFRSRTALESIASVGESCHEEPDIWALTSASGQGKVVAGVPDLISRYNDFQRNNTGSVSFLRRGETLPRTTTLTLKDIPSNAWARIMPPMLVSKATFGKRNGLTIKTRQAATSVMTLQLPRKETLRHHLDTRKGQLQWDEDNWGSALGEIQPGYILLLVVGGSRTRGPPCNDHMPPTTMGSPTTLAWPASISGREPAFTFPELSLPPRTSHHPFFLVQYRCILSFTHQACIYI